LVIDVNAAPTASVSADRTSGDAPLTVNFTGNADDSDGTFSIRWDFGDGSPPVTNDLSPTHQYVNPGTFQVTLTVTDDRGAVTVSDPVTITVGASPP
jgi:PKD repeat protein